MKKMRTLMTWLAGCALMLAAMFFTSVVFTFRDCFEAPESPQSDAPPSAL